MEQQIDGKRKLTDEFNCEVITPIFSYGSDNSTKAFSELRPTSLKGLMRNTFRIVQQKATGENKKEAENLLNLENQLFGDAKEISSPIKLAFLFDREKLKKSQKKIDFLFHEKARYNPSRYYISSGNTFVIRLSVRNYKNDDNPRITKDTDWYKMLIELSLMLDGLGQRSRKGRGRVRIVRIDNSEELLSQEKMKKRIECLLNEISLADELTYELVGKEISLKGSTKVGNRPVIERLEFGKPISKKPDWEKNFLKSIDNASHEIQKEWGRKKYATGSSSPRFASSVMIGVAEVEEGFLPIYTYVKPVSSGRYEKRINGKLERERFVELIKSKLGGGRDE